MFHETGPPSPGRKAAPGLVAFLDARLRDDETAAQAAIAARGLLPVAAIDQSSDHRARHGPVRVLRDVAAKRAMVRMWLDGISARRNQPQVQGLDVADAMIMALVSVYADHREFRSEWLAGDRPEQLLHPSRTSRGGPGPDNVIAFPGGRTGCTPTEATPTTTHDDDRGDPR